MKFSVEIVAQHHTTQAVDGVMCRMTYPPGDEEPEQKRKKRLSQRHMGMQVQGQKINAALAKAQRKAKRKKTGTFSRRGAEKIKSESLCFESP